MSGVVAKVVRAYQHLDALDVEIARFVNSGPYTPAVHTDADPNYVRIVLECAPIPPGLAMLSGDLAQNLRAALDHLAWQLVIDNGGTPSMDPPVTQFPIRTKPPRDSKGKRGAYADLP